MTDDRVLRLQGIHNFRDYGGYRTQSGAVIARGRLYRSGHLSYATQADIDRVAQIKLGLIVDLRSDRERHSDPSLVTPTDGGQVAFIPDADSETPHLSSAFQGLRSREEAIACMTYIYTELPFNPDNSHSFGLYLNQLAASPTPSLVHCFAGKDRTGLAVALFQHLLGLPEQDIYHDYLLTNEAGDARLQAGMAGLRAKYSLAIDDVVLEEAMLVRAEYLAAAFAVMKARFGSLDNYVISGLGVSAKMIARLRLHYLE